MASLTFRRSALTQPETWKTTPQGLSLSYDGVNESLCPYQNIKSIRLFYYPTRQKTNNYICEIDFINPPKMKIPSISYVSFANFEDRKADYNAFVKELTVNVAQQNPICKFYAGKPLWKFILEQLLVIFILAFIFFIFSIIGSFSPSGIVIVKFLLIAFSLYYIIKGFLINIPKPFDPLNVPPKILPSL